MNMCKSHLLQMRGLKRWSIVRRWEKNRSHLLQMRGLKHIFHFAHLVTGCRIFYRCVDWNVDLLSEEEKKIGRIFYRCVDWNIFIGLGYARPLVASFTDAWIETRCCLCEDSCRESHLLQMRGLKPRPSMDSHRQNQVASFTDAWIETPTKHGQSPAKPSRIFYRCVDWNPDQAWTVTGKTKSHLLQMRGLKPRPSMDSHRQNQVASFTDAWIETKSTL